MATRRRRKPVKPTFKERLSTALALRMPVLEQRHWDVIGLGLVALGIFLACVLYVGWAGGRAGEATEEGLRWLLGVLTYVVPVGLVVVGSLIAARPFLPARRPLRAGTVCMIAALALAIAAGTLGLGPSSPTRGGEYFRPEVFEVRSGAVGETIYWAASSLLGQTGTHILAVFLLAAGALLLTGATLASILHAAGTRAAKATARVRRRPVPAARPPADEVLPPEPDTSELVIRATHVEAPSLDGAERYPDLFGDEADTLALSEPESEPEIEPEPGPDPQLVETKPRPRDEPTAEELTPQGRFRKSVT